jgi:hypothetical protein
MNCILLNLFNKIIGAHLARSRTYPMDMEGWKIDNIEKPRRKDL